MLYGIAGGVAILGVVLVVVGLRKARLKSEIGSTHTSRVADLSEGQHVEVKGRVSCDQPIEAPGYDVPCIYYSFTLKRRERERNSDGKTTYRWRTIDSGDSRTRFTLTDSSGSVVVDPDDAKIDAPEVVDRYVEPGEKIAEMAEGPLKTIMGAAAALGVGDREKIEVQAIAVNSELYVLADVRPGHDGKPRLAQGEGEFFISTKSEEQLQRSLGRQSLAFYVAAGTAFAAAVGLIIYALR